MFLVLSFILLYMYVVYRWMASFSINDAKNASCSIICRGCIMNSVSHSPLECDKTLERDLVPASSLYRKLFFFFYSFFWGPNCVFRSVDYSLE